MASLFDAAVPFTAIFDRVSQPIVLAPALTLLTALAPMSPLALESHPPDPPDHLVDAASSHKQKRVRIRSMAGESWVNIAIKRMFGSEPVSGWGHQSHIIDLLPRHDKGRLLRWIASIVASPPNTPTAIFRSHIAVSHGNAARHSLRDGSGISLSATLVDTLQRPTSPSHHVPVDQHHLVLFIVNLAVDPLVSAGDGAGRDLCSPPPRSPPIDHPGAFYFDDDASSSNHFKVISKGSTSPTQPRPSSPILKNKLFPIRLPSGEIYGKLSPSATPPLESSSAITAFATEQEAREAYFRPRHSNSLALAAGRSSLPHQSNRPRTTTRLSHDESYHVPVVVDQQSDSYPIRPAAVRSNTTPVPLSRTHSSDGSCLPLSKHDNDGYKSESEYSTVGEARVTSNEDLNSKDHYKSQLPTVSAEVPHKDRDTTTDESAPADEQGDTESDTAYARALMTGSSDATINPLSPLVRPSALTQNHSATSEVGTSPTTMACKFVRRDESIDLSFLGTPDDLHLLEPEFLNVLGRTPVGKRIRSFDWSQTSVGPMSQWTETLKTALLMIIQSPHQSCLYWGDDSLLIYNDAYLIPAGGKHPWLLGKPGQVGWSEIWTTLAPVVDQGLAGDPYSEEDGLFFFERRDDPDIHTEECYHTWSFIPIRNKDGVVEGILNTNFETTGRVITDRRLATLQQLLQITNLSRTTANFWDGALSSLGTNTHDLPFIILYTCETIKPTDDESSSQAKAGANTRFSYVGGVGVPAGHKSAPLTIDLQINTPTAIDTPDPSNTSNSASSEYIDECTTASMFDTEGGTPTTEVNIDPSTPLTSCPWPFREACSLRRSIFLNSVENRTSGFESRGWEEPTRRAVVVPISATPDGSASAVIVMGLNTRRSFDESTATFIQLLSRHLSTGLSAVQAFEMESERAQELNLRVQERTKELFESEAKIVQAAVQRAKDAEERKAEYERFVDMTSHELRNPLSAVWQLSELLDDSLRNILKEIAKESRVMKNIEDEVNDSIEAIASIKICVQHQRRICDDILSVSKLGMGLLTLSRKPFDIARAVRDVVKMFTAEARHRGMELEVNISPVLNEVLVLGDEGRLTQVVLNFLGNALKAGGGPSILMKAVLLDQCPDPVPGSRRVGATGSNSNNKGGGESKDSVDGKPTWLKVSLKDGGRGMSEADMAILFSRFAQVKPSTDQYGGAGLGLFICRRLIELHHGFIEVFSEPLQGSTFSFCIPTETTHRSTTSIVLPTSPSCVPLPNFATSSPGKHEYRIRRNSKQKRQFFQKHDRKSSSNGNGFKVVVDQELNDSAHVLVVEDNKINLQVLTRQLTKCGYVVHQATNGREGLDLVYDSEGEEGQNIDIILMDNEMPILDGLSACRELRTAEANGKLRRRYPLIGVTGNARQEQIEELLDAGFDSISVKPYDFKVLHAGMQDLILTHDYTNPPLTPTPVSKT